MIFLKWFGGMIPRLGEQHLKEEKIAETGYFATAGAVPDRQHRETGVHATDAQNTNLYSGELRPLHAPSLTHTFPRPEDDDFVTPEPPVVEPPEYCPPDCVTEWEDELCLPPCYGAPPICPPGCIPIPPACKAVMITSQPSVGGDPVLAGATLVLEVEVNAEATAPITYQWFRNGIAIAGAVDDSYTIVLSPEDSYVSFSVRVANPCGEEVSTVVAIPEVEEDPPPECEPYACDAYRAALIQDAVDAWGMEDSANLSLRAGGVPMPIPIIPGVSYFTNDPVIQDACSTSWRRRSIGQGNAVVVGYFDPNGGTGWANSAGIASRFTSTTGFGSSYSQEILGMSCQAVRTSDGVFIWSIAAGMYMFTYGGNDYVRRTVQLNSNLLVTDTLIGATGDGSANQAMRHDMSLTVSVGGSAGSWSVSVASEAGSLSDTSGGGWGAMELRNKRILFHSGSQTDAYATDAYIDEYDIPDKYKIAWDRNQPGYTPPEYCPE